MVDRLLERAEHLDDPVALVSGVLDAAGERSISEADICARTAIRPQILPALLEHMRAKREVVPVGRTGRWIRRDGFERVTRHVDETVRKLHEKDTAVDNLPLAAVRSALSRVAPVVLEESLAHLMAKGRLIRMPNGNVKHKDHSGEMPEADREKCERVLGLLASLGARPPALEDLEAELGLKPNEVNRALRLLDTRGDVFKAEDYWFATSWVENAQARLRAFSAEHDGFTPSEARTLLDTTRKWIIPLLEALDKSGFTRRVGTKRVVKS
jgi:selenocysteine-specific elongation factor